MREGRHKHASVNVSIKNTSYVMGGNSNQCVVFDGFSLDFSYIKPVLSFYRYAGCKALCAIIRNKIRIYNGITLDATVFAIKTERNGVNKKLY